MIVVAGCSADESVWFTQGPDALTRMPLYFREAVEKLPAPVSVRQAYDHYHVQVQDYLRKINRPKGSRKLEIVSRFRSFAISAKVAHQPNSVLRVHDWKRGGSRCRGWSYARPRRTGDNESRAPRHPPISVQAACPESHWSSSEGHPAGLTNITASPTFYRDPWLDFQAHSWTFSRDQKVRLTVWCAERDCRRTAKQSRISADIWRQSTARKNQSEATFLQYEANSQPR